LLDADPEAIGACTQIWRMASVEPLRIAVCGGESETAELLLRRGANVNHAGGDGKTALDHAQADANTELCDVLVRHGGRVAADL